nr:hypothetical protein BaRGS_016219 [Batillaria attramentaria]
MCTVSTNPDDLTKADAVVFGNWWITRHDPPARQPHQLFIYYNMNSSNYVRLRYFFPTWRSAFNWTWSYRRDSDIFQPAAFLQKVKPPHTYRQYKVMVKEKSQLAFLVKKQSRSQSKVEEYVERLSQEITVTQIPETEIKATTTHVKGSADLKDLANQHFFYLSFEKALCADFVTDAFFDLYDPEVNAVPVVRGRADYRTMFPQDTFVDSSIAAGPKELAASLKELSMNLKLYSAMLWRKSQYVKRDGLPLAWCQLCEKLHSYHGDRYYEDIQSWWWKNGQCHTSRRI